VEESGSLFSPDYLRPSQFADLQRAGPDGIRRLMLAILEISLRDATGVQSPIIGRKRRWNALTSPQARARADAQRSSLARQRRRDARAWIFGDGDGPFSFRTCCETLEIDGEKLRERIRGRSAEKRPPLRAAHRLRAAVIRPAWRAGPDAGLTLIRTS
jgi:hypothetical protein